MGAPMSCGSHARKRLINRNCPAVDLKSLTETGRLQFFYHSPSSKLPIRDVLNEQHQGYKTEPHLEASAENYCTPCLQPNIRGFINCREKYLFLFTTRRDPEGDGARYIVGYLQKKKCLLRRKKEKDEPFLAVQGPLKLVSFADAFPLREIVSPKIRGGKRLNEAPTARLVNHFRSKKNLLRACLNE